MELSQILDSLSSAPTEKTASYSAQSASLEDALSRALDSSNVKTASARGGRTPSQDLEAMAVKLANAEQHALLKEAELYGAAVADGFMARMGTSDAHFGKQASYLSDEDIMVKQAMELGYNDTKNQLDKIAEASYAQGFEDTIKEAAYAQGFEDTIKEAAYAQGFEDTIKKASYSGGLSKQAGLTKVAAIVKQAADNTARDGYRIGLKMLANLPRRM